MDIKLPENFRIQRMSAYQAHYQFRDKIPADAKMEVLADTGWFFSKTNMDAEPDQEGVSRYRVVLVKGEETPQVISDSFHATQPGGYLSLSGPNTGFHKAKDQTPYLSHDRWIQTVHWYESHLTGEYKNKWLHPRFTPVKAWMRTILAVEKKRSAYVNKAIVKARAEAAKKYPFPQEAV